MSDDKGLSDNVPDKVGVTNGVGASDEVEASVGEVPPEVCVGRVLIRFSSVSDVYLFDKVDHWKVVSGVAASGFTDVIASVV